MLQLLNISILAVLSLLSITRTSILSLKVTSTPPLLDVPAYSLATVCSDGSTTMNIHTYASPVGIRPDRKWGISLYRGTLSHENFVRERVGVLQLLREPHAAAVKLLGGSSGREVNKQQGCDTQGLTWMKGEEHGPMLLPQCAGYMRLSLQGALIDAGDHDIAICTVEQIYEDENLGTLNLGTEESQGHLHLTTGYLRRLGLITPQGRVAQDET